MLRNEILNSNFNCNSPKTKGKVFDFDGTITTTPKSKTSCQNSKSPNKIKRFQRRDCTPDSPPDDEDHQNYFNFKVLSLSKEKKPSCYDNRFSQSENNENIKKNRFLSLIENVIYEDKNEDGEDKGLFKNLFGGNPPEKSESFLNNENLKNAIDSILLQINNKNWMFIENMVNFHLKLGDKNYYH